MLLLLLLLDSTATKRPNKCENIDISIMFLEIEMESIFYINSPRNDLVLNFLATGAALLQALHLSLLGLLP